MPRKSPSKDSNGGNPGQFTTEVKKTIDKAREEGRRESAEILTKRLEDIRVSYQQEVKYAFKKGAEMAGNKSSWAAFLIGGVIFSALTALAMSV